MALIGLAIWIGLTLGLAAWAIWAPEAMPQFAVYILIGSVFGAPTIGVTIFMETIFRPRKDEELPARDASDTAEAAMRDALANKANNRRPGAD
ncbi:MAG: hypothetical protein JXQ94_03945 [Maricaulis maris]